MDIPFLGILLALFLVQVNAGGIPGMNRVLKAFRRTFNGGGGRRGGAPVTTTTTTMATTTANLGNLNLGALPFDPVALLAQLGIHGPPSGGATGNRVMAGGEGKAKAASLEPSGSQNVNTAAAFNPADLLGQLSI